ncbi:hypothetical protein LP416_25990 [Polaromonas sp. P2-4]|nr:hypothetical protein LP416_25990 [Polaromonas sp. P2-4]
MDAALLREILAALALGHHDEFESGVVDFLKTHPRETLWTEIGAKHGSDFDLFEQLRVWPDDAMQVALRRLVPAVSQVQKLTLEDAVRFLDFAARVPMSYRHSVAKQLRPHIARDTQLGVQLGNEIRRRGNMGEGAMRVWADAFSGGSAKAAAEFAVTLVEDPTGVMAQLAVLLQYLDGREAAVATVLMSHEARLSAALERATQVQGEGMDAWMALTAIASFSVSATTVLLAAAAAGTAAAISAIANWLYRNGAPKVGATDAPIEGLAKTLVTHAVQNESLRRQVDSVLASLLQRKSTRSLVFPCFAELGAYDIDPAEAFSESLQAVCDEPDAFTRLLTEWLLAPGVTFTAIRGLLSLCITGQAPVGLNEAMFATAGADRKVVAARRLLALAHNGPVLCQFIAFLAESPDVQPDGLRLAAEMLNEAFVEYPGATEAFLKDRTRPAERTKPFSHVYRGVYANALRWRRVLARLPEASEVQPTESQRRALRAMHARVNRDILRAAKEQSVFAQLATNITVSQGRRFATHTALGPSQVGQMQQTGHSIELPSSELADPVGGMFRRAQMLEASR